MNVKLARKSVYIAMLSLVGAGVIQTADGASVSTAQVSTEPSRLAQMRPGSSQILRGQCRAVRRAAFVYKSRSLDSMTVMRLDPDQTVILAENSAVNGFIAIETPELGYVQIANLKPCTPNSGTRPTPSPTPNPNNPGVGLCRRITSRNGLDLWSQPESRDFVARLPMKSTVYLTDPPAVRQGSGDRLWIRIARPVPGWAVGSVKGVTVLTPCN